eukprot:TRINITY_DN10746_c0_g1_i3.p1 TRINITY_DN10746_c0_g1~~TRINITY_DN10746_c0_g1_i3.p1  ORF type:complete len:117 (+),score=41.35 TRINITY_DN10746_c0_g1_i3:124-474(+)
MCIRDRLPTSAQEIITQQITLAEATAAAAEGEMDGAAQEEASNKLEEHAVLSMSVAELKAALTAEKIDYSACVETVSYTHLRAHETPEHLVCRLLLEKKKNKPHEHRHIFYNTIHT